MESNKKIKLFNYEPIIINKNKYINNNLLSPQWPFRFIICGPSGCGKTNVLLNLIIQNLIYFHRIYLYAKNLNEYYYEFLDKYLDEINCELNKNNKNKIYFHYFTNNINKLIPLDDIEEKYQNLIIFDDFVTEKDQSSIIDYFIRGRKQNCSLIYITQSFYSVPKDIRLNCDYISLFSLKNHREINDILSNYSSKHDREKLIEKYKTITKNPFTFFLIDNVTNSEKLRYRKNFDSD